MFVGAGPTFLSRPVTAFLGKAICRLGTLVTVPLVLRDYRCSSALWKCDVIARWSSAGFLLVVTG